MADFKEFVSLQFNQARPVGKKNPVPEGLPPKRSKDKVLYIGYKIPWRNDAPLVVISVISKLETYPWEEAIHRLFARRDWELRCEEAIAAVGFATHGNDNISDPSPYH